MQKIKLYIITVFFIIFALLEFVFLQVLPSKVNLDAYMPAIMNELQKETKIVGSIGHVKFDTFCDFSVNINADYLKLTADNDEILYAKNLNVRFYLLPLLIKHLRIRTLSADSLKVSIERTKDGKYNFSNIELDGDVKDFDIKLSKIRLNLAKYDINFDDKFYGNKYNFAGDYFFINKFKPDKFINVAFIGNLTVNDKQKIPFNLNLKTRLPIEKHIGERGVKADVYLPLFDASLLQNYVKEYLDKDLKELSGALSVKVKTINSKAQNEIQSDITFTDLNYLRNRKDMSVVARGNHSLKAKFNASDKTLTLKDVALKSDYVDVTAHGTLKNFTNPKSVKLNIETEIKNSRSDYLYWLMPSEIPTDYDMIRKVKNYGFFADVNGKIKVKGKGMTPDVLGKVDITQAYVTKPFAPHVPKADIFLEFMGKYVHFKNRSFTDKNEYVDVLGDGELYGDKNVDMSIKSTKNVDLVSTYQVLVPVHDVLGFEIGPVPEMAFYGGVGNIDLIVKGNIENPDLYGVFRCENTTTSMNGLNAKLTNSAAELLFQHKTYHFNTKDAYENGQPIEIKGDGNWFGVFDFDVIATDFSANEGFNVLKGSELFEDYKEIFPLIDKVGGKIDLNLNLKGEIKVFDIMAMKDKLEYKADVIAKNVAVTAEKFGVSASSVNGKTFVSNKEFNSEISGLLNNAQFDTTLESDTKNIKVAGSVKNLNVESFLNSSYTKNLIEHLPKIIAIADVNFDYSAKADKLYPEKIQAQMTFKQAPHSNISAITVSQGWFNLKNGTADFADIVINCFASVVKANGKIKNIFSKNIQPEIVAEIKKFDLYDLNKIVKLIPVKTEETKILTNAMGHVSGIASGRVEFLKNKLNGNIDIKSIILKSAKISQSVVLGNTTLKIKNNNLDVTPFTFSFYQAPVFLKVSVNSLLKNPKIDLYSTAKLNSAFFDELVNNYLSYPVKLKGESVFTATVRGQAFTPEVFASLRIPVNSDISYAGANLGDTFDARELFFNAVFDRDKINLKHLVYKKYIDTQNNRSKPMQVLNIWGNIVQNSKGFEMRPLNIRTDSPANAGFFNILFKKSVIKNGNFDCNMKITGNAMDPFVTGKLSASNVDMPTYNAKIRDMDIDLFQNQGDLMLRAQAYGSEIEVNSKFKNSTKMPVEIYKLDILSKYINVDNLTDNLTKITYSDYATKKNDDINNFLENIAASGVIIHSGTVKAKDVMVNGLNAQKLDMNFSLNKNLLLNIKHFVFEVAQGVVDGNISYNLKNTDFKATMAAKGVNAAPVVKALFMLDNQIYGKMNGNLDIKTKGYTDEQRASNLNGHVSFEIVDGKMPKLGSLEYLLRASNLLENGITGMSINSIVQILVPLRTGDFSKLHGELLLSDGVAKNIQIYTVGKSLNLYITGMLELLSGMAQMEIWGKLDNTSKSPLGIITNASLNSVFKLIPWINLEDPQNAPLIKNINKIPGIELSAHKIRVFRAVVNGDINSDKFVEKFEWVKN